MTRMAISLGSALLLILLIAPATAEDRVYNCWAIISSPSIEETGLPDLLTAALSKSEGLKLVERDRLQLATKELELSALAGSGAAGQRLKLGRLLGADALALLSLERPEKSGEGEEKGPDQEERQFVKLVISDCTYGARLWVEFFPYVQGQREQLAARCAMLARRSDSSSSW